MGWDLERVEEEEDGWANRDSLRGCVHRGFTYLKIMPFEPDTLSMISYQSGYYTRAPTYQTRVFALQIPVTPDA